MRYTLRRLYINRQGYTSYGVYYGVGAPVYEFDSMDGRACGTVRGRTRELAKQAVRAMYECKDATFYR